MANYSDFNLDNGQYVPQYAGLPLDQIKNTADTLSERHYQNLANLNQLQLVAEQYKSKMLPGARSYVDQHLDQIGQALGELAKNGGENATARVGAITNKFLGDQGVLQGLERSKEYNQQTSLIDQLKAKGEIPLFDQARREQLASAPVTDPLYSSPYSMDVEPYRDPNPEMEDIWKVVNPDSYESEIRAALGTTPGKLLGQALSENDMPLFFESLTKSGISGEKIKNNLNNAWSNYKNSASFKQQTGKLVGKNEAQLKNEFFAKGLTRVFSNLQRDYKPTPAWAGNGAGGKQNPTPIPTKAPGQTVESLFDYNTDGYAKGISDRKQGEDIIEYKQRTEAEDNTKQRTDFNPQYVKDYQTMAEIMGTDKSVKPESKEAKELASQYKALVGKRISNPWTLPVPADVARDINYDITSQYSLHEYMDPTTGKVFTPYDNSGQPTDEFLEVTGGDPSKFRVESVYDAKNHYTLGPASNEKFVKPIGVVSQDKDGNQRRFLMSQLPAQTTQEDINTNSIYTKVNLRPGQMVEVTPRVKARELHGAQLQNAIRNGNLSQEDVQATSMPIEATVDGETYIFDSPEHLSRYLVQKGINLPIK